MFDEFKKFILRGSVIDLAVGVVVGAAFNGVVQALVKDILTPFIAAIAKAPDFSGLAFTINGSKFMYGDFINTLISFLLVATSVFFFVVKPMNVLASRGKKETGAPTTKKCVECLSEIPVEAKRCAHCAQAVA